MPFVASWNQRPNSWKPQIWEISRLCPETSWLEGNIFDGLSCLMKPEAEFLDVIGTKFLRFFLLAIHCHLYLRIYPPPPSPQRKIGLKLVCNVNIMYGNLKSEKSQDYAQKHQRHCTFMNSASGYILVNICLRICSFEKSSMIIQLNVRLHKYSHFKAVNFLGNLTRYNRW